MIVIHPAVIEHIYEQHGEPDMFCCYAEAQSLSASAQQTILMINDEKVIAVFIGKFTNNLVQKEVFYKEEISNSTIKSIILVDVWKFFAHNQKWKFKIQGKILTLGRMQGDFLDYLYNSDFIHD